MQNLIISASLMLLICACGADKLTEPGTVGGEVKIPNPRLEMRGLL